MKILRNLLCAVLSLALSAPAIAMDGTSIPPKFPIQWANSASASFVRNIPVASQIGISNGAASLTDGFPPLTFQPVASGGIPPDGRDFNGILKQATQALRWAQAGGMYKYDSAFSTAVGGYPKGANLQSNVLNGRIWTSTVDNNTTDPDSSTSANWVPLPGTNAAGTPVQSFSTTAPTNTVPANGLSIGNASSNATNRANADTFWLFSFLWTSCSRCQVYNSSGTAISRGSTALSDWNANDAIATFQMQGVTLVGSDTIGGVTTSMLSGVPVSAGSTTIPMSVVGENLHSQSISEMASHFHSEQIFDPGHTHASTHDGRAVTYYGTSTIGTVGSSSQQVTALSFGISPATTGVRASSDHGLDTTYSAGGGGPANIVSRSFIVVWNLTL